MNLLVESGGVSKNLNKKYIVFNSIPVVTSHLSSIIGRPRAMR